MRSSDIKRVIAQFYKTNLELSKKGEHDNYALNIVGPFGIGKTSLYKEFAEENNIHCEILNLGQFDEIGQLRGFPTVRIKIEKDNTQLDIDLKLFDAYRSSGWKAVGDSWTEEAIPNFIKNLKEGDILVLDDYQRNLGFFNNAVMELIKEKRFGSWKLPKGCSVFATSNPDNGEYNLSQSLDGAQLDRKTDILMDFNMEDWVLWAESKNIPDIFINFIYMNPEVVLKEGTENSKNFKAFSPRKWSNFFIQCNELFTNFKDQKTLEDITELGAIWFGSQISILTNFISNSLHNIVTVEYIFKEKNFENVKKEIDKSISLQKGMEKMVKNILTYRISNYIVKTAREGSSKELTTRIEEIMDSKILEKDQFYQVIKSIAETGKMSHLTTKYCDQLEVM